LYFPAVVIPRFAIIAILIFPLFNKSLTISCNDVLTSVISVVLNTTPIVPKGASAAIVEALLSKEPPLTNAGTGASISVLVGVCILIGLVILSFFFLGVFGFVGNGEWAGDDAGDSTSAVSFFPLFFLGVGDVDFSGAGDLDLPLLGEAGAGDTDLLLLPSGFNLYDALTWISFFFLTPEFSPAFLHDF